MKITKYLNLILIMFLFSCSKEPVANFTYIAEATKITFINTSENSNSYHWTFDDGATSTEKNPVHTYLNSGVYLVTLEVTGEDNKMDITTATINLIAPATNITIINPLPSQTDIYVNGSFELTVPAYDSAIIANYVGGYVTIAAESYGMTNDDTKVDDGSGITANYQIGDVIEWEFTQNLTGEAIAITLKTNFYYYFLFIENTIDTATYIVPFYVNCDDPYNYPSGTSEYFVNIKIPNDSVRHPTGWFSNKSNYNDEITTLINGNFNRVIWFNPLMENDYDYYQYKDLTTQEGVYYHPYYKSSTFSNTLINNNYKPHMLNSNIQIPEYAITVISTGSKKERRRK